MKSGHIRLSLESRLISSANLAGKDGADAYSYQEKQVHEALRKLAEAKRKLKGKQP